MSSSGSNFLINALAEVITGAKTFTSQAGTRFTTWVGIGAGVGSARNPVYINTVVNGAAIQNTLAAGGGDDYVGMQTNIKFEGDFSALKTNVVGDITSGTNTLTLTSGTFTSPIIVGYTVYIPGAGVGGGLPLKTKIVSITDSTHAVLAANASTTVTGAAIIATLAADHNYAFMANDFYTTSTTAGALSGIDNVFGRLTEVHLYTPNVTLNAMKATSSELDIEASATGSVVTSAVAHEVSKIRNDAAATVTNAYGVFIHGSDTATATNVYGLYVDGQAKNYIGGELTVSAGATAGVPLKIQLPLGGTGEMIQGWDYTFANKRFHVSNGGAVGCTSFVTAFEGLGASTAIGSMTGGFAGIRFGSAGVEIAQTATAVASVRGGAKAFGVPSVTTANRATAATAGAGALCHDSTLATMIYSDGTNWRSIATNGIV